MFQSFRAPTGEPVFSYEGRLLCSKVAPQKESAAFVEKHFAELQGAKTAFVLGLGGGHVIEAICHSFPQIRIVVLETEGAIFEGVSRNFTFNLMNMEVVLFSNVEDLKNNAAIRQGLAQSYCVLSQPVTKWLNVDLYRSAEELLLGRAPGALTFVLSQRPDLREALRPLLEINETLASIKTLNQNLNHTHSAANSKTKLLIKTLRELVV